METWYQTGGFGVSWINPVEVVKSTEKTVTLAATANRRERRSAIMATYECYFRTWEEAHAYLLEKAEANIESIRRNLERAKGYLGNIRGLKNPD